MKRFALLAAVMIWGLQTISAQQAADRCCRDCKKQTVEQRVERKVNRMKDCLKLTDKQVKELTAAYTKLMKEEEKTRQLREETEKKVDSILTDEQKEMRCKNRHHPQGRKHKPAPPHRQVCPERNECPGCCR